MTVPRNLRRELKARPDNPIAGEPSRDYRPRQRDHGKRVGLIVKLANQPCHNGSLGTDTHIQLIGSANIAPFGTGMALTTER